MSYSTNFPGAGANLDTLDDWIDRNGNSILDNGNVTGNGRRAYTDGATPGSVDYAVEATHTVASGSGTIGIRLRDDGLDECYQMWRDGGTGNAQILQLDSGQGNDTIRNTFVSNPGSPRTIKGTVGTGQQLEIFFGGVSAGSGTGDRTETTGSGGIESVNESGSDYAAYSMTDNGGGGGGSSRGTPFGHRGTAFNGGRTFHGVIQ